MMKLPQFVYTQLDIVGITDGIISTNITNDTAIVVEESLSNPYVETEGPNKGIMHIGVQDLPKIMVPLLTMMSNIGAGMNSKAAATRLVEMLSKEQ